MNPTTKIVEQIYCHLYFILKILNIHAGLNKAEIYTFNIDTPYSPPIEFISILLSFLTILINTALKSCKNQ